MKAHAEIMMHAPSWLTLRHPDCSRDDAAEIRRRAQELAWDDLQRQATLVAAGLGRRTLGRVTALQPSDVELRGAYAAWSCNDSLLAEATVGATFELR